MQKIVQGIVMLAVLGGLFTAAAAQDVTASGQGTWTGTVSRKGSSYFFKQDGTNATVELRGTGLAQHAGHRVQIKWTALPGQTPAPGASQVVMVEEASRAAGTAAVSGGAKAAGSVAKAGLSKAAIATGVGAGATGATVGSLYAADVIGGDDQPASQP